MSYYDSSKLINPITNNIRRIFREKGFKTQKEMALLLGENPDVFKHYIWVSKREIPSHKKLRQWADILEIPVSDFLIEHPIEKWPYRPPRIEKPRKTGIGYRKAIQIRKEIIDLLPSDTIMSHEGLHYLFDKYNNPTSVKQYTVADQKSTQARMVAEE